MWFDSWSDVLRVVVVGIAAYVVVILAVRVSGKRALAQLNAFDFVVTVALGSVLATILLSSDVAFAEGLVAIVLLLGLQVVVALLVRASGGFRRLVTARPALLASDGAIHPEALRRSRVTREDVLHAVRKSGAGDMTSVGAVILESDGTLSVISADRVGDRSALADVPSRPAQP